MNCAIQAWGDYADVHVPAQTHNANADDVVEGFQPNADTDAVAEESGADEDTEGSLRRMRACRIHEEGMNSRGVGFLMGFLVD